MSVPSQQSESTRFFDVIIIGAGLSGLNSAYRLQSMLPGVTFTILEGRDNIGGTWDLFRYPGVRSDSDLFTFGFAWRLWPFKHPVGEGHLIMSYLWDSISLYSIPDHIRFRHKVTTANWSSKSQRWNLKVDHEGESERFQARFIILGTGYYNYESPMKAVIPGLENFQGEVIHPQFWPDEYDYAGKRIAIIGSGATAITLLPALAEKAARVTMVQRSPSYIYSVPNHSRQPHWLRKYLPLAFGRVYERLWHMCYPYLFVVYCHYFPLRAREALRKATAPQLPDWISYDPHFNPKYNPWEQRLCMTPDGDFYEALRSGKGDVVTGTVKTVTDSGIQMEDGSTVDADAIVTATGLDLKIGGNIDVRVDGKAVVWGERLVWNGAMIEGVPNLNFMIGYANASWTPGVDDAVLILIRLMKFMQRRGLTTAIPRAPKEARAKTTPMFSLTSTYLTRAQHRLPKWGCTGPWRPRTRPPFDWIHAMFGNVTRDLEFDS